MTEQEKDTLTELAESLFARAGDVMCQAKAARGDTRDTLNDAAGVLFALSEAVERAAQGAPEGLDELAAHCVEWLGDQRFTTLGGMTLKAAALTNPETN